MFYSPKTSADGLVFNYDTGNTVRSYLGEPTTNTVGQLNSFNPLDLYTWTTGGHQLSSVSRDTSITSPVRGTVLKVVTSGTSAYGGSYSSSGFNIAAASVGQTWTMSIYIKAPVGSNPSILFFEANSAGNYTNYSQQYITPTGEWQRLSVTRTLTDATTAYVQGRFDMYTSGVTVYYDGLQVEQKSKATQFTVGTRSATQGLKDLTAKNTINISTVSFDSNAQMTFDGTDDYALTSNCPALSNWSTEVWLNPSVYTSAQKVLLDVNLGIRFEISNGYFNSHFGNGSGWIYTNLPSTTQIAANKWFHVVVTVQSGGQAKVYVNGALENTLSIGSGTTPNIPLYIGRFTGASGYEFNGNLSVVKIYGQALTADQVQRNFNAVKSRFNIA
jgi:hypothetical protein